MDENTVLPGEVQTTWFEHGLSLLEADSLDQAASVFSEFKKLVPKEMATYKNLSIIYHRQGKIELAIKEVESFIRLYPQNREALQALEQLKSEETKHSAK